MLEAQPTKKVGLQVAAGEAEVVTEAFARGDPPAWLDFGVALHLPFAFSLCWFRCWFHLALLAMVGARFSSQSCYGAIWGHGLGEEDRRDDSVPYAIEEALDLVLKPVFQVPLSRSDGVSCKDVFGEVHAEVLEHVIQEPSDFDPKGQVGE